MVHGRAAGDLMAAEIREALQAEPSILQAFSGRIVEDAKGWALPCLSVHGREDGTVQVLAAIRGTPSDAADKLSTIQAWMDGRSDLVRGYRDSFRAPDKREAFAVMVIRRREPNKLQLAA